MKNNKNKFRIFFYIHIGICENVCVNYQITCIWVFDRYILINCNEWVKLFCFLCNFLYISNKIKWWLTWIFTISSSWISILFFGKPNIIKIPYTHFQHCTPPNFDDSHKVNCPKVILKALYKIFDRILIHKKCF